MSVVDERNLYSQPRTIFDNEERRWYTFVTTRPNRLDGREANGNGIIGTLSGEPERELDEHGRLLDESDDPTEDDEEAGDPFSGSKSSPL